ncbi:MAG: helix-turn-helix transcriptional regulator [Patescibacteria group bacterium]
MWYTTLDMYEKEYIYESIGGPKKYHKNRIVKKVLMKWVPVHHYKQVDEQWYKDLLLEFRQARAAKKLTQQGLAGIIGSNQAWVSSFECGRINPTVEFLARVAKALDKEIDITLG